MFLFFPITTGIFILAGKPFRPEKIQDTLSCELPLGDEPDYSTITLASLSKGFVRIASENR
jgi:hypothetical protein